MAENTDSLNRKRDLLITFDQNIGIIFFLRCFYVGQIIGLKRISDHPISRISVCQLIAQVYSIAVGCSIHPHMIAPDNDPPSPKAVDSVTLAMLGGIKRNV